MNGSRKMILVVDDDPALCRLLSVILESEGFEVEVWESPTDALERLKQTTPGLVVLDLMMPELDGLSFWRRARAMGCSSPLFVLSASNSMSEVADLMGAADCLAKPFDPDLLIARVRRVLAERPED